MLLVSFIFFASKFNNNHCVLRAESRISDGRLKMRYSFLEELKATNETAIVGSLDERKTVEGRGIAVQQLLKKLLRVASG